MPLRHLGAGDLRWLKPSHQEQNQQDDKDYAKHTAWSVAPGPAVRPCRHGADQKQDHDDEQDSADTHGADSLALLAVGAEGVLPPANRVLNAAFDLIDLAFGAQLAVADQRAEQV